MPELVSQRNGYKAINLPESTLFARQPNNDENKSGFERFLKRTKKPREADAKKNEDKNEKKEEELSDPELEQEKEVPKKKAEPTTRDKFNEFFM